MGDVFSTADTIVAIATPPGRGGVGVVRLAGPHAARVAGELVGRADPFTPRHATFCRLIESTSDRSRSGSRDHVVVTMFPAPHSYTGDEVAEVSAHGSPVVLEGILEAAISRGARLAEPGEFTLRAFLNGKIDLVQAEAVADLIEAVTPLQARTAFDQLEGTLTQAIGAIEQGLFELTAKLEASLDFPEEGYHFLVPHEVGARLACLIAEIDALVAHAATGRLVREGAHVAIVGSPNVGKSSLFNALLNTNRTIVTSVPGTTRDLVTERADIGGLAVSLVDTAGLRETMDVVEQEGVRRTRGSIAVADVVLVVVDRSRPLSREDRALIRDTATRPRVAVVNKVDLPAAWRIGEDADVPLGSVEISAETRQGLDGLRAALKRALMADEPMRDRPAVTNIRHAALLERTRTALTRAAAAVTERLPEEFPLSDLQEAAHALQEITGRRSSDDLLHEIFRRFCIGK